MGASLQQLLSFPPKSSAPNQVSGPDYDKSARSLVETLRDTSPAKLTGPISGSDTILDIVDPATHSLPYLHALTANLKGNPVGLRPGDKIWQKAIVFVSVFDAVQVRYSGAEFRELVESFAQGASQSPLVAIEPISTAILRLDPSGATLTSSHLLLVRLCLQTKAFALAQTVLDHDIYHLPTPTPTNAEKESINIPAPFLNHNTSSTFITTGSELSSKLSYQDHLQYHLYGAMIYIGLWKWERALEFLEAVISAPVHSNQVSMIQVEAFKKWVLVSLLVHGKPQGAPRGVHTQAVKHLKNLAKAYEVLAEAFKEPSPDKLRAEIQAGPFVHDNNYSLALLVLSAHQRFKVRRLSNTFSSLPLSQVAILAFPDGTSLQEVQAYIENLITNSQLPGASIMTSPTSETYLHFDLTGSSATTELQLYKYLSLQRQKVEAMGKHMNDAQRKIEVTKEYLEAVRKTRKAEAKSGKRGPGSGMIPGSFDDDMVADM